MSISDNDHRGACRKSRRFNWKAIAWKCATLPVIALIYWVVNSQGLRMQMPIFGLRLYKLPLPGFSLLEDFEGTYRLDIAHAFALFLLFAVWHLLVVMFRIRLLGDDLHSRPRAIDADRYRRIVFTLGTIIFLGDALLFFSGMRNHVDSLWGATTFFVPLVATIVYMAVLAFVSFMYVLLETDPQTQGDRHEAHKSRSADAARAAARGDHSDRLRKAIPR